VIRPLLRAEHCYAPDYIPPSKPWFAQNVGHPQSHSSKSNSALRHNYVARVSNTGLRAGRERLTTSRFMARSGNGAQQARNRAPTFRFFRETRLAGATAGQRLVNGADLLVHKFSRQAFIKLLRESLTVWWHDDVFMSCRYFKNRQSAACEG
jgi:hypothetical protein